MHFAGVDDYQMRALRTKHLPEDVDPRGYLLMGLSGEVGSLIAEVKKRLRDEPTGYRASVQEEVGDVLWYLAALADMDGLKLSDISQNPTQFAAADAPRTVRKDPIPACLRLATAIGELVALQNRETKSALRELLAAVVGLSLEEGVDPDTAASKGLVKADSRWPEVRSHTPLFDDGDHPDERLPRTLHVEFRERRIGNRKPFVVMKSSGLQIGDRITDNIAEPDDYQFHDIFHMSYVAVLGWSPVFRGLLRCKRKSNGNKDETEDGARAAITEEAVVAWVFRHAATEGRGYYENNRALDYATLKQVRQLTAGYEVEDCPPWQWEQAILQGFEAFRFLRRHRSGLVTIDMVARELRITAAPPEVLP